RRARRRPLPARRAARPRHREPQHLAGPRATRRAEERRVRREERCDRQGDRWQRVRHMVRRTIRKRSRGFTYLTALFVIAILLGGLALAGEMWETSAARERE